MIIKGTHIWLNENMTFTPHVLKGCCSSTVHKYNYRQIRNYLRTMSVCAVYIKYMHYIKCILQLLHYFKVLLWILCYFKFNRCYLVNVQCTGTYPNLSWSAFNLSVKMDNLSHRILLHSLWKSNGSYLWVWNI